MKTLLVFVLPVILPMDNGNEWNDLRSRLRTFTVWAISGIVDGAFLALWVVVQFFADSAVAFFDPSGISQFVLPLFQILFAVSTLAPIAIYIYADIRVMVKRARRRIDRENNYGRDNGRNSG